MEACIIKRHPLRAAKAIPSWPSYSGVSQLVGSTADGRVTVYVDPSLGAAGLKNAQDLLADVPRIVKANDALFGTTGGPVNVIVFALGGMTDGTGGADHMSCDYVSGQNIEVDASFGSSMRVSALFEAELSECSMGGNLCGESTGESLSRWCAMAFSANALSDFATGPTWAADGMPNFVDSVDPTDRNFDATGCGMAFLSWLMSKAFGYSLTQVTQAMVSDGDAGTLASLYSKLTANPAANAWPNFSAAVKGLAGGVQSDDPFNALVTPAPAPSPNPNPTPAPSPAPGPLTSATELASMILSAIGADLVAGDTEAQLKADIQSILDAN